LENPYADEEDAALGASPELGPSQSQTSKMDMSEQNGSSSPSSEAS
jgi:hypothetical protein